MQKNKLPQRGFTLIEILIVLSIIAILATVFINVSTISTKKARDGRRLAELKQYQNALEIFANKNNGFYPSRTGTTVRASVTTCADVGQTGCPEDPKYPTANFVYYYQSDGDNSGGANGTKYVMWDKLEAPTIVTYQVVCSNGKSGQLIAATLTPSGGTCPLP